MLTLSFCGWVGGVGWGLHSYYIVKPNLVLRLGWGFDKNLLLQKLLSLVCYLRISHKNWKLIFNLDKNSHFITLETKQQIKEILLQKLHSFVFNLRISNKKWKFSSHMVTKAVILSLSKLTKIFYKTSFCYAIQECES